jgi:hypothetical protein
MWGDFWRCLNLSLKTPEKASNPNPRNSQTSGAAGQKNGHFNRERNVKKRRLKYGKNRNGFSSLKENWTGSTGSSGWNGLRPKGLLAEGEKNPVNPVNPACPVKSFLHLFLPGLKK